MAGVPFGGSGTNLLGPGKMTFSGSILCTNLYWGVGAYISGTPTIPSGLLAGNLAEPDGRQNACLLAD